MHPSRTPSPALPRIAAAVAAAGLALAAAIPAAASVAPVGKAKALNQRHSITAKTYVVPVAATSDKTTFGKPWAVYTRYNRVGNTPDSTGQLLAVTTNGRPTRFGAVTADMRSLSLSGDTLTAASAARASRVYWWRPSLPAGQRGYHVGTVGADKRYLSSAPDGWVEVDAAGMLYDVDAAVGESSARALTNPFGSAQHLDGVSGPTGIVVWNEERLAFVSFANGHVTSLDLSRLTNLTGGTNTPVCWSVSASAAACGSYYFTGEDNSGIRNVFLDPLDGAPAYAVTGKLPAPAMMLGAKAAGVTETGHLRVLSADGLVTSTNKVGAWPVGGLGGFLTTNSKRHVGTKVSANTKHTSTVLTATKATSEATEFALAKGSVVWLESASSHATVHRRTVTRNSLGTGLKLGASRLIARSKALHGELAAAGHTFAYPTDLNNSTVGQNGGETLRVVSPARSTSIHGVDRYMPVTLGDHRVAYYHDDRNARLYDLRTGKTVKLAVTAIALSGHWLAYADQAGTIRLKDLKGGAVRTVATGMQIVSGQLFVRGQVVAWNAYPPGAGGHNAFYRDMSTSGSAVQLPTTVVVWQLSDAGLVLEHTTSASGSIAPNFPADRAIRFHEAMTFLLQPYDGSSATTLLVADYPHAGPRVAGHVVVWIDQFGNLRARALA